MGVLELGNTSLEFFVLCCLTGNKANTSHEHLCGIALTVTFAVGMPVNGSRVIFLKCYIGHDVGEFFSVCHQGSLEIFVRVQENHGVLG